MSSILLKSALLSLCHFPFQLKITRWEFQHFKRTTCKQQEAQLDVINLQSGSIYQSCYTAEKQEV